jgi:hypothetical protein
MSFLKFEDVTRMRVRTSGKRSDSKDISVELDWLDVQSQEQPLGPPAVPNTQNLPEPVADAAGVGGTPSNINGAIDFLQFGADLEDCTSSIPRVKRTKRPAQKKESASEVVETLKQHDSSSRSQSTGQNRLYVRDFDGILDDAECDDIEHIIASENKNSTSSSSTEQDRHGDHEKEPAPSDEEVDADFEICKFQRLFFYLSFAIFILGKCTMSKGISGLWPLKKSFELGIRGYEMS